MRDVYEAYWPPSQKTLQRREKRWLLPRKAPYNAAAGWAHRTVPQKRHAATPGSKRQRWLRHLPAGYCRLPWLLAQRKAGAAKGAWRVKRSETRAGVKRIK
ncbi:hypothetical protein NPIL_274941 [Nephila pilipes]|uniref:Uncharacterized protein n=1 Tax=Nephila pilipes TaxID=299642 RepID=A0A8X6U987_NEPPI|nr:hypothetical protein NPIL_274941 [Nephila pilipes]